MTARDRPPGGGGGVAAAVLAGGASRRMGRDKATLPIGGVELAGLVVATAGMVAAPVVLVAPAGHPAAALARRLGVGLVTDPGDGPLAALAAGLAALSAPHVLVLATDHPALHAGLLAHLVAERGAGQALACRRGGRLEPLVAVYEREPALAAARSRLAAARTRSRRRATRVGWRGPPGREGWFGSGTARAVSIDACWICSSLSRQRTIRPLREASQEPSPQSDPRASRPRAERRSPPRGAVRLHVAVRRTPYERVRAEHGVRPSQPEQPAAVQGGGTRLRPPRGHRLRPDVVGAAGGRAPVRRTGRAEHRPDAARDGRRQRPVTLVRATRRRRRQGARAGGALGRAAGRGGGGSRQGDRRGRAGAGGRAARRGGAARRAGTLQYPQGDSADAGRGARRGRPDAPRGARGAGAGLGRDRTAALLPRQHARAPLRSPP